MMLAVVDEGVVLNVDVVDGVVVDEEEDEASNARYKTCAPSCCNDDCFSWSSLEVQQPLGF